MSSVVNISLDVIQKFNPSENEIRQIIKELDSMLTIDLKVKEKAVELSENEKHLLQFEEWFKAKLYPPKVKFG